MLTLQLGEGRKLDVRHNHMVVACARAFGILCGGRASYQVAVVNFVINSRCQFNAVDLTVAPRRFFYR